MRAEQMHTAAGRWAGTRLQGDALILGQALLLQAAPVERHPVAPGGEALLGARGRGVPRGRLQGGSHPDIKPI